MHWVTLAQAAKMTGASKYALMWGVLTRQIRVRRVTAGCGAGHVDWLVDASELEAWKASRLPSLISY